jgi:predicted ATPase/DNA-binding CsgD family transcriptional regulator/transcriptional regulator with XRE-family HTH domain
MATHDLPLFGELLRRYRLAAGLTQEALARQAGLSARGIADLERGARRSPYPDTIQRLAEALLLDATQRASLGTAARRASALIPNLRGAPGGESRHNLPASLTSFVGRDCELADVQARLADARLLTLTGVGGCGKTRLALEVARTSLHQYRDGIWLVELAPLADPALVQQRVSAVVGAREMAGQSIVSALAARLRSRRVLLVLDNCEHLLDACAQLVDALVRACPDVKVLATSREALGLTGEVAWRVPSLPVPDSQHLPPLPELQQNPAVRLFFDRATAAQSHFVLTEHNAPAVVQICQRLDGIPLALELGAARMDGLTAEQLAVRLDERFRLLTGGSRAALPRQQTLRATVDWSYDLLSEPERRLFSRLSVFAGGWTLEAAEAVCAGDGIEHTEVLDLLLQLVRKSMVVAQNGGDAAQRYRLLETLRQYARKRLLAVGEEETLRRQHATHFLAFQERLDSDRVHPTRWAPAWAELPAWSLDQLEPEQDNLRIALRWLIDSGDAEHALGLAEALFQIAHIRGSITEGQLWLRELLSETAVVHAPAVQQRVQALRWLTPQRQGQYDTAIAAFQELLAANRSTSDRLGIASVLCALASVHFDMGDYAQARACLEGSQSVAAGVKDQLLVLSWRNVGGGIALHEGWLEEARVLFLEAMAIRESMVLFTGWSKKDLGWVALEQGAYPEARSLLVHAIQVGKEFGDRNLLAYSLEGLSGLAAALGQHERAVCLAGAGAMLREASGGPLPPTWQRMLERWLTTSRAALSDAAVAAAWKIGHAMPLEEAILYALEPFEATAFGRNPSAEPEPASALDRLTRREREVAALVAQGMTNGQIAEQLVITQRTVAAHIEHILNKLGFASRTQVGVWAAEHRLVEPSLA